MVLFKDDITAKWVVYIDGAKNNRPYAYTINVKGPNFM